MGCHHYQYRKLALVCQECQFKKPYITTAYEKKEGINFEGWYDFDMLVSPLAILPSQDYLKPETIKYIFECIEEDELDKLPPMPIVRKDKEGRLIAIDGHNFIAVMYLLNEAIEVHVASSAKDGIVETSDADKMRNRQLKEKFDTVIDDRRIVEARGWQTFQDLIGKYPGLFEKKKL